VIEPGRDRRLDESEGGNGEQKERDRPEHHFAPVPQDPDRERNVTRARRFGAHSVERIPS
jgi:hypothetical protein